MVGGRHLSPIMAGGQHGLADVDAPVDGRLSATPYPAFDRHRDGEPPGGQVPRSPATHATVSDSGGHSGASPKKGKVPVLWNRSRPELVEKLRLLAVAV